MLAEVGPCLRCHRPDAEVLPTVRGRGIVWCKACGMYVIRAVRPGVVSAFPFDHRDGLPAVSEPVR